MCVWSLPKVFHTCGKNCGNCKGFAVELRFRARFFGPSRDGESEKYCETGPSFPVTRREALKMAQPLGAKVALRQIVEDLLK
jgi:hypothetical protein